MDATQQELTELEASYPGEFDPEETRVLVKQWEGLKNRITALEREIRQTPWLANQIESQKQKIVGLRQEERRLLRQFHERRLAEKHRKFGKE